MNSCHACLTKQDNFFPIKLAQDWSEQRSTCGRNGIFWQCLCQPCFQVSGNFPAVMGGRGGNSEPGRGDLLNLLPAPVPAALSEGILSAAPSEFVYNLCLQFDGLCGTHLYLRL